jgi:hypothetical protein
LFGIYSVVPNVVQADRKLVHHRDRVAVLETEGEKLSNLVEKEKQQIETLEQIIAVIDRSEVSPCRGGVPVMCLNCTCPSSPYTPIVATM